VNSLSERLRAAANAVRTKSMPLSDFIPLLQQAADALDAESERCATICDNIQAGVSDGNAWFVAGQCARAIRSSHLESRND
jgi:hypothetical protein